MSTHVRKLSNRVLWGLWYGTPGLVKNEKKVAASRADVQTNISTCHRIITPKDVNCVLKTLERERPANVPKIPLTSNSNRSNQRKQQQSFEF